MSIDQKLTAIRDTIQQDVGNRGLARDPVDNLITACPDDFANACASIADHALPRIAIVTGFFIPAAEPPAFETDGPLGALMLARALGSLGIGVILQSEPELNQALAAGLRACGVEQGPEIARLPPFPHAHKFTVRGDKLHRADTPRSITPQFRAIYRGLCERDGQPVSHRIALERVGPNYTLDKLRDRPTASSADVAAFVASVPEHNRDRCFTMRGRNVTEAMSPAHLLFESDGPETSSCVTIGIGDGGNEIGMGKIAWDTIRRNIPNGELVACRVATDHLIVAGVSNWGAYALAAGVALLRGVELPEELFDPDRERTILQKMVEAGPLVDGVTGRQTATVDGLSWDDYIRPLVEIGKIVRA